jgi:hypothetical protein
MDRSRSTRGTGSRARGHRLAARDGQDGPGPQDEVAERLDELGIAARRLHEFVRWLRLLEVRMAPKASRKGSGVYPNERSPFMREFVSPSTRNPESWKYSPCSARRRWFSGPTSAVET